MRKANISDKNLVVEILTESFKDNKSVNYILKEKASKSRLIKDLMIYSFNIGIRYGDVFLSDDAKACSIILFPKRKKSFFYSTYQDLFLIAKVIGVKKLFTVMKKEKDVKLKHPDNDFAHLWYIGVYDKFQGKGIGTKLLSEIKAHYKKKGLNIYLETSTEPNIPFYKKNGFDVFYVNDNYGFRFYHIKN